MKYVSYFICFFICGKIIFSKELSKIINELKPHHVTIFTNRSVNSSHDTYVRNIISETPSIVTDLNVTEIGSNPLYTQLFQNPRPRTIYNLFMKEFDLQKVYFLLDKLARLSPIQTRPKCLLTFSTANQNLSLNLLKKVLHRAWSLKFLDFTIIVVDATGSNFFFNWNPFTDVYNGGSLRDVNNLFPDKAININKHALKILAFHIPPFVEIDNQGNNTIKVSGIHYSTYLKTIERKLNAGFNFTMTSQSSTNSFIESTLMKLKENNVDMSLIPMNVHARLFNKSVVTGYPIGFSKLTAVVPVITKFKYDVPLDSLIFVLSFPTVLAIFLIIAYVLKFKWTAFDILAILIGYPIFQPHGASKRIIFLAIAMLSIFYTNLFFSKLTDIKVIRETRKFESVEDLIKSEIPIYTYLSSHPLDSEDIKTLFSRSNKIDTDRECIDIMIQTQGHAICIMQSLFSLYYVKKYMNSEGSPIMKLGPSFRGEPYSYAYEKSSPLAEKIDGALQQLIESSTSIDRTIITAGARVQSVTLENKSEVSVDFLFEELVAISLIGFSLAIVAFVFELIKK